jgi:predicted amino acid racemase
MLSKHFQNPIKMVETEAKSISLTHIQTGRSQSLTHIQTGRSQSLTHIQIGRSQSLTHIHTVVITKGSNLI